MSRPRNVEGKFMSTKESLSGNPARSQRKRQAQKRSMPPMPPTYPEQVEEKADELVGQLIIPAHKRSVKPAKPTAKPSTKPTAKAISFHPPAVSYEPYTGLKTYYPARRGPPREPMNLDPFLHQFDPRNVSKIYEPIRQQAPVRRSITAPAYIPEYTEQIPASSRIPISGHPASIPRYASAPSSEMAADPESIVELLLSPAMDDHKLRQTLRSYLQFDPSILSAIEVALRKLVVTSSKYSSDPNLMVRYNNVLQAIREIRRYSNVGYGSKRPYRK